MRFPGFSGLLRALLGWQRSMKIWAPVSFRRAREHHLRNENWKKICDSDFWQDIRSSAEDAELFAVLGRPWTCDPNASETPSTIRRGLH